MAAAVESAGELRLAVSCAGIGWAERTIKKDGPAALGPFETVVRVNLIGTFNVLRLAAASIAGNEPDAEGERGAVVMTASIAAFDGQIGQTAYSASKGGVVGLTLPAARDLARHRHPGLHDRAGPVRHPAAGRAAGGDAPGARRTGAVPAASRAARGVRTARVPDRRELDAERRDDQARRRSPDAAQVALREGAAAGRPRPPPPPRRPRRAARRAPECGGRCLRSLRSGLGRGRARPPAPAALPVAPALRLIRQRSRRADVGPLRPVAPARRRSLADRPQVTISRRWLGADRSAGRPHGWARRPPGPPPERPPTWRTAAQNRARRLRS